ncbi:MAG: alpha/beta family hydrolase [Planctomycetota bacterium]|nr:alpha/beta family hydrolase [Planctomycetota bacterium]
MPHHTSKPRPTVLTDGPRRASHSLLLAHGAGAGMRSEFMCAIATGLGKAGIRVTRFEFPYMLRTADTGVRRPPDREPVLRERWQEMIHACAADNLVIGGKSLGGRIASLVASDFRVAGLVCLGYPFHPVGRPTRLRTAHLETLRVPTLILQGERDRLGNQQEVAGYTLSDRIQVQWLTDGDHDLVPRKQSGRSRQHNWEEAVRLTAEFIHRLPL